MTSAHQECICLRSAISWSFLHVYIHLGLPRLLLKPSPIYFKLAIMKHHIHFLLHLSYRSPKEKSSSSSRYCCVPDCHNTSTKYLPDGNNVTLHRIPTDPSIRRLWLSRLRNIRKNLPVNNDTRVCIAHFKDYKLENLPTIFPSKLERVITPRRQIIKSTPEAPTTEPPISTVDDADTNVDCRNEICGTCGNQQVDTMDVGTQHEVSSATISTQTSCLTSASPDITLEDLSRSDDKVRFYTGFVNFQMCLAMFRTLLSRGADRLNYC